jgi:tetrahydromethanopterin S-methyltransferase subunit C
VAALPFLNLPFFVGPINGIIVSLIVYSLIGSFYKEKVTADGELVKE